MIKISRKDKRKRRLNALKLLSIVGARGETSPVHNGGLVVGTVIPPPLELEGLVKPAVVVLLIDDVVLFFDGFFLLALSPRASSINASAIWRRFVQDALFLSKCHTQLTFLIKELVDRRKDRIVPILGFPELGKIHVIVNILLNAH